MNPSTKGLVMFSGSSCPACVQAAQIMNARGIQFTEVKIDGNAEVAQMLAQTTGQRTIPQFFLNGDWLSGGFRQVQQLAQQNALG